MKYMMSIRQPLVKLHEADEIKVDYKDRERLYDLMADEPLITADIYIYIPRDQLIDWDELNRFKEAFTNSEIKLGFEDAYSIVDGKNYGYKCFWSYPATTFYEVRGLIALGVHEILLDAPLFFNLEKVKALCENIVELRIVANKCFNNYMPRETGVCGTYVRPEDVETYSQYIDHIEFITDTLKKELTLIDIYKNKKKWPGNLNLLLTNLKVNVDNRGFDEDFAKRRMNCGQVCQIDNRCHYCSSQFLLINTIDKNKDYLNETYELN